MKIFKVLFSRMVLLGLLILLQLAAIVALIFILLTYNEDATILTIFYVTLVFLEILVALFVVNRDDKTDMKVPWILALLALPILGILCYVFFANHGLSPKQKKNMRSFINTTTRSRENPNNEWMNPVKKENPEFVGTFEYLKSACKIDGYTGNSVKYFKVGEEFFPDLIESLKQAERFILMEFFIVSKGKEWDEIYEILKEKARNGVQVKVMYDDIGSASTFPRKILKDMRKNGIEAYRFNPFRPVLSGLFNNRDHRKICVIDHKVGYTGGCNLADEYANDIVRFGYWKDSMIKIEGPAIRNLILLFFELFDLNRGELSNYSFYLDEGKYEKKGNALVLPFGDGPKPYQDNYVGEQTFINLIQSAQRTIYISSPYLIPTDSLYNALKNAAMRGVKVRLLIPGIPDKKMVYLLAKHNAVKLVKCGVNVYTYTPGFNHEKCVIIDDKIAFIGTINLDYRSLVHHFECGAIIYDTDAIHDMTNSMVESFNKSEQLSPKFKLNWFKRFFCNIINLFAPLL